MQNLYIVERYPGKAEPATVLPRNYLSARACRSPSEIPAQASKLTWEGKKITYPVAVRMWDQAFQVPHGAGLTVQITRLPSGSLGIYGLHQYEETNRELRRVMRLAGIGSGRHTLSVRWTPDEPDHIELHRVEYNAKVFKHPWFTQYDSRRPINLSLKHLGRAGWIQEGKWQLRCCGEDSGVVSLSRVGIPSVPNGGMYASFKGVGWLVIHGKCPEDAGTYRRIIVEDNPYVRCGNNIVRIRTVLATRKELMKESGEGAVDFYCAGASTTASLWMVREWDSKGPLWEKV